MRVFKQWSYSEVAAASSSSIISCLFSREDSVLWISSGWRWLRFSTCSDLNWEVSQVIGGWEFQWPAQAVERDKVPAALNDFRGDCISTPTVFGNEISISGTLNHPAGPGAAWKHGSTQGEQFLLTVWILPLLRYTVLSYFLLACTKKWCFCDKYPSPSIICWSQPSGIQERMLSAKDTQNIHEVTKIIFFFPSQHLPSIKNWCSFDHTVEPTGRLGNIFSAHVQICTGCLPAQAWQSLVHPQHSNEHNRWRKCVHSAINS